MHALTRLLPHPGDRMGCLWNLLALKDSYVIEYGPAGTTHFGIGPMGALDLEPRGRYFVTHMDESDVVMGDSSRLERAVIEIDRDHSAEHIFIVGSSIAATIGTDLEGIVFYLQDQVDAKLHIFDSGGFKGDLYRGMKDVYETLAKILEDEEFDSAELAEVKAKKARPNYNLLGASPDHYRLTSDVNEISRILTEALDVEIATTYVVDGCIADFKKAATADFSLVLRDEALPLAEALEKLYAVPYFLVDFYGYEGTKSIVEAISALLQREIAEDFSQDLTKRQKELALFQMSRRRLGKNLHLFSVGNRELNRGLNLAFGELGLEFEEQIEYAADEQEKLRAVEAWQHGLIFADSEILRLAASNNAKVLTSFPWLQHMPVATHLPIMGVRGMDWLYEKLLDYLQNLD
ncbi:MAG: nitrogenase component 1 [Eubacteriales bacterium]|nr:nitrogenase component 1 [Eubacteriales bacterium]